MSDSPKPITYGLDEARYRLRNPPPSRSSMYGMIKDGVLEVSGYIGDRPFFTDQVLQNCAERLMRRQAQKSQNV
jgi:hypothetical protein